ncbi:DUF4438 domain-containing protein, partial [Burkholderia pseudomallei]|nr:DUF4438 domain-containing protein [Burkholderia pseudomallei]
HRPGVPPLLTGPADVLMPVHEPQANLAEIFGIRRAVPPRQRPTLAEIDCRRRRVLREQPARLAFGAVDRSVVE